MTDPRSDSGTFSTVDSVQLRNITFPRVVLAVVGVSIFALLTFVGANIRIPMVPVPFTLQTLFVILAGAVLGSRTGALSQAIYLSLGAFGVPLFAGSVAGIAAFAGPTGGYLVGFVFAAFIVGRLIDRKTTLLWQAAVFALASLVILLLGALHLALVYTHDFGGAFTLGFLPFLLGDAVKVFAAVSIYRSYSRLRAGWTNRSRI